MRKTKRILAIIGVALLVALYGSTLVFAIFDHTKSLGFLKASIACTILLPVLLYAYTLIHKLINKNDRKD